MKILPLTDDLKGQWNLFCDWHPGAWFWHRAEWIEYCLAYAGGSNYSFAVTDRGGIIAICPLLIEREDERMTGELRGTSLNFSMGHDPCLWPLGSSKEKALIEDCDSCKVREEIERIAAEHAVRARRFRSSPLAHSAVAGGLLVLGDAYKDISWSSRVIDLTAEQKVLWRGVRASYHSLIHRANERLAFHGGEQEHWRFAEYERLHKSAHGGRPQRTYDLQAEWLLQGHGLVYTIWTKRSKTVVGAAYFNLYKQKAYYGSAAYLEPDVACALIWYAMLDLKRLGIQRLEMGWQGYARDEKGKNIEFMKRGFGGQDVPLHVVEKQWNH